MDGSNNQLTVTEFTTWIFPQMFVAGGSETSALALTGTNQITGNIINLLQKMTF